MTIAFDAVTATGLFTATKTQAHTPAGTPRGVLVPIVQGDVSADQITGVTYGGVAMTEVTGSPFLPVSPLEPGAVYWYFLGSGIPTGTQDCVITCSASTADKHAAIITYTAAADMAVHATGTIKENASSDVTATLALGGVECAVALAAYGTENTPSNIAPLSGWGASVNVSADYGSQSGVIYSYDTVGSADVTYGVNDSIAGIYVMAVAIKEVAGSGTVDLEGSGAAVASAQATLMEDVDLAGAAAATASATGALLINGVFAESTFTHADNTSLAAADSNWFKTALEGVNNLGVLGNKLYGSQTGSNALYTYSSVAPSPDYSVSLDITTAVADLGSSTVGVVGRYASSRYYKAAYVGGATDAIVLARYSLLDGGYVTLGTYALSLSASQTINLRLEMVGTAISVYVDGNPTPVISVTDSTATAAGQAGVYAVTQNTTDWTADNFSAALHVASGVDLAGAAAATAAASGAITTQVPLAAASIAVATAAGAMSVSIPLAGSAAGEAAASGDLSTTGSAELAATATASASAAGGLSLSIPLSGSAVAQALAQAAGPLSLGVPLSGAAIAEALAAASLETVGTVNLSAAAVADAVASAALTHGVPLSGEALSAAVAAAGITVDKPLVGTAGSDAVVSAALAISKALEAAASSSAAAAGGLSLSVSLSGAAIAGAAALANLTASAGTDLSGAASASASASASLSHDVPLSGASLAVSGASGNITQLVPLTGAAASASGMTGGLDVTVNLSADALAQAMANGDITHIALAALAGSAAGEAGATGTITLRVTLDGGAVVSALAEGLLTAEGLIVAGTPGWEVTAEARDWTISAAARDWTISAAARDWSIAA